MLTRRVLPPEEWDKVAGIPPFNTGGLPNPEYWRIVVVERDGQIVACCSLFDTVHWDMFWVAAESQGAAGVFRELLLGGAEVMLTYGIRQVHTTVPDGRPELVAMLDRFGFERAPGALYTYTRED